MKKATTTKKSVLRGVPEPTIRRLPMYLSLVRRFATEGDETVSSTQIAKVLKFDSTQVTKDIAYTGITGKTRVGYVIIELAEAIEELLGFNKVDSAFLVGAGKLGTALLSYSGFNIKGLKVIAAFDTDYNIVGTEVNGVKILPYSKMADLAKRMHVTIGIICTPAVYAQDVSNDMVGAGIKGIWNFSPRNLDVPDDIAIENTSIYPNLAILFNKMKKIQKKAR